MPTRLKTILLRTLLVVVSAGVLYVFHALLTTSYGKFVGFANSQPSLQVSQPVAKPSSNNAVRQVLDLAEYHFASNEQLAKLYWPRPGRIEEHSACWLIAFTSKIPIYELLGIRHTLTPTEPAIYMTIDKSDLSMRWGKWCQ